MNEWMRYKVKVCREMHASNSKDPSSSRLVLYKHYQTILVLVVTVASCMVATMKK